MAIIQIIVDVMSAAVYPLLFVLFAIGICAEFSALISYGKVVKYTKNSVSQDSKVRKKGNRIEKSSTVVYTNKYKEEIIQKCERPNKNHAIAEQIAPLMPLLGILGTVLGLFGGLSNLNLEGDMTTIPTELFGSMRYALLTTVLGILFAVAIKILGIFVVSIVESINTKLDVIDAQNAQIEPENK